MRVSAPSFTSATSATLTWADGVACTTSRPMSSSEVSRPCTRTSRVSSPSLMRPAPSLRLKRSSVERSSSSVTPVAAMRAASGTTS